MPLQKQPYRFHSRLILDFLQVRGKMLSEIVDSGKDKFDFQNIL